VKKKYLGKMFFIVTMDFSFWEW